MNSDSHHNDAVKRVINADHMPVVAVVLAAGFGTRFDPERPKQLVSIQGLPVVAWSIRAFELNEYITDIVVVTNATVRQEVEHIIDLYHFNKVRLILDGGAERYESSYKALQALEEFGIPDNARVLIHDAVRPFVSQRVITDAIGALDYCDAATVAMPSTDTIILADPDWHPEDHTPEDMAYQMPPIIKSVPDRKYAYRAQTPQAFEFWTIRDAYKEAMKDEHFSPTDDTRVVIDYMPEIEVAIVNGEQINMKITTLDDLPLAETLAQHIVEK